MNTTLLVLSLVCGLPILLALILAFIVIKWGVKTLWKIVTWPFRAIAGLFHKNETPAPVAAPVAVQPVQDDRARNGAVTQTVTVNNNNGAAGTALAFVTLVVVLAIVALGLFFLFRPVSAPVVVAPACNGCEVTSTVVPTTVVVNPTPCLEENCPVARHIDSNSNMTLKMVPGNWYHLNISVDGFAAGTESNVFLRVKEPITIVFDGSAWEYDGTMPSSKCQICSETAGDRWITLPIDPNLVEYDFPCGAESARGGEIIKSITTADGTSLTTDVAVASGIGNGKIVQGENVSGTVPATAYAALYWWVPGDSNEYVFLFRANSDVSVSGFNGTLVRWDHKPTSAEIGDKPVKVPPMTVTFAGEYTPFESK